MEIQILVDALRYMLHMKVVLDKNEIWTSLGINDATTKKFKLAYAVAYHFWNKWSTWNLIDQEGLFFSRWSFALRRFFSNNFAPLIFLIA